MGRLEPFWGVMCDYTHYLWLGVMMLIFLFVLALFGFYFAEPGTGSYAINIVNAVLIVSVGSVLFGMFWVCHNRREDYEGAPGEYDGLLDDQVGDSSDEEW